MKVTAPKRLSLLPVPSTCCAALSDHRNCIAHRPCSSQYAHPQIVVETFTINKNGVSIFQLPGCYPGLWAVGKAPGGSWDQFSPRGVQIRARGTELCSFLCFSKGKTRCLGPGSLDILGFHRFSVYFLGCSWFTLAVSAPSIL